jgi:acetamidase/formamidase
MKTIFTRPFLRNDIDGNYDSRYLGQEAVMFAPVNVPGALFKVGDEHLSRGGGEITGTAHEPVPKLCISLTIIDGNAL